MKRKRFWKIINSTTFFLFFLTAIILTRIFVFVPVTVLGESMSPTLADGERGIALKVGNIKRFDIVTFPAPDDAGKNYIKRVIGLPGDSVTYQQDTLYINDVAFAEPYLDEYKAQLDGDEPLTLDFSLEQILGIDKIPEGKVFVLGDNRRISKDSRYIGLINQDEIQGDMKFSYWPPEKFGIVN